MKFISGSICHYTHYTMCVEDLYFFLYSHVYTHIHMDVLLWDLLLYSLITGTNGCPPLVILYTSTPYFYFRSGK